MDWKSSLSVSAECDASDMAGSVSGTAAYEVESDVNGVSEVSDSEDGSSASSGAAAAEADA